MLNMLDFGVSNTHTTLLEEIRNLGMPACKYDVLFSAKFHVDHCIMSPIYRPETPNLTKNGIGLSYLLPSVTSGKFGRVE